MSYNLGRVVGVGITSIEKTGTSGLVDTYTITLDNGNEYTFTVTNGEDGQGGADIVTSWESTLSDEKIPSEKLTKETIDNGLSNKVNTSDVANNLTTTDSGKVLDARQGKALNDGKINTSDIVDNLTTDNASKVLSAKQGKALKDLIGTAITYINQ